ncbi:MAG: 30S ribosomal protein S6 [Rhodospirillaceae bacterium]|nr:30S ribosomal protein S6 [Rhodospirillaceae bacterium]
MAYYECVFIARQELSSTQAEQLADEMAEIISNNGGEVRNREYWGLKNLAYRIKKNRKGHYTMFHLEAPSDAVREMERNMGLNEDILRHLTIRLDELPEGPSIMMQAKSDRGDRGRRGDRDRDRPPRSDRDETPNPENRLETASA